MNKLAAIKHTVDMKKQLLLLLSLLAISTAAFAGCTTPTNDKEKTNVNKDEVIQEKQNEDDCEDGNCGSEHKFIQPLFIYHNKKV